MEMGTCGASVKILDKVGRLGCWKRKKKKLHWFLEALNYHLGYVIMVLETFEPEFFLHVTMWSFCKMG